MGSSHTPGRPHKFPLGVVDTWKDNDNVSQHIPIHPDNGCAVGWHTCLECPLPQCLEDLKRTKKE